MEGEENGRKVSGQVLNWTGQRGENFNRILVFLRVPKLIKSGNEPFLFPLGDRFLLVGDPIF